MTDKPDMLSEHGMRCPDCGQSEAFRLDLRQSCTVTADGVIDVGSFGEWNDDTPAYCENEDCGEYGIWQNVKYFKVKKDNRHE